MDRGRSDLRTSLVIGICCFLIYNANFRSIGAADTYGARYLPLSIWKHGTVLLDPIEPFVAQGRGATAFWIQHTPDGHAVSLYPVAVPLLVAPLYLPAAAGLKLRGWTDSRFDRTSRIMEKVTASLIAALSSSLLYLLLRRRAKHRVALLLTIAYAFGTTTWVISSQALWQHGMAQLLVVGSLLLLTGTPTKTGVFAAGIVLGLLVAVRPPDAIIAAALGAFGLFWSRKRAPLLILGGAIPGALLLAYNLGIVGRLAGAYSLLGKTEMLHHPLTTGLAGLLFSPTRGLFVFSPFLLFLVLAFRDRPRERRELWLTLAMASAIVLQLVLYAKFDWRGGWTWGPRFLTDVLPLMLWMLVPVVAALRGILKLVFVVAVAVSVGIEAIGAVYYTASTDRPIFALSGAGQFRPAWQWRNAPFIAPLKKGPAKPELLIEVRGRFERLEVDGVQTSTVHQGQDVTASGWALAGNSTPRGVGLWVDSLNLIPIEKFHARPDIKRAIPISQDSGWSASINTRNLSPGVHRIPAVVWASETGEGYFIGEQKFTVVAPRERAEDVDLGRAFKTAIAHLRRGQQPGGYWLTNFTAGRRFEQLHSEVNVYTTAMIVETLDPVADELGLKDSLKRAHQHLAAQIEPDGLVRFHGRPDSPWIGSLGIVITPDTDDTSLTLRLAPERNRDRLRSALDIIEQYRGDDGFYRVWLAPREKWINLETGDDPNPADIGIQMNLFLLLNEARPAAGSALCTALKTAILHDRYWVYYDPSTPMIVMRQMDLARAGCELRTPEPRADQLMPDQEIWNSVVKLIDAERSGGRLDEAAAASLLRQLAANDFSLLRANPPYLFHNDLSAGGRRFYWSQDFGYALWLRLAQGYVH